jgi:hypothetical protein
VARYNRDNWPVAQAKCEASCNRVQALSLIKMYISLAYASLLARPRQQADQHTNTWPTLSYFSTRVCICVTELSVREILFGFLHFCPFNYVSQVTTGAGVRVP